MVRSARLLGNLVRWALLVCTLLAICTLALWTLGADVLDSWDEKLVLAYEKPERQRLLAAEALADQDPQGAIDDLTALLEDLDSVLFLDRLDPVKRRAYAFTVGLLLDGGQTDDAIDMARGWVSFDGNDVDGRLALAGALLSSPEGDEEGMEQLRSLYLEMPEVAKVTRTYLDALVEREKRDEAYFVFQESLQDPHHIVLRRDWQLVWTDNGENHVLPVTPRWMPGKRVQIQFPLKRNIRTIRIDPPNRSDFFIEDCRLAISTPESDQVLRFEDLEVNVKEMERVGPDGIASVLQDDPRLLITLPRTPGEHDLQVTFSGKLGRLTPDFVHSHSRRSDAIPKADQDDPPRSEPPVGENKSPPNRTDQSDFEKFILKEHREKGLRKHDVTLTIDEASVSIHPTLNLKDGVFVGHSFEMSLPFEQSATEVVLTLPPVPKVMYSVIFVIQAGNRILRLNHRQLVAQGLHIEHQDIDVTENGLRVSGAKPVIRFEVPGGIDTNATLSIRGETR